MVFTRFLCSYVWYLFRHLIADHLGWFKDSRTGDGKLRTIELIMKEKGELVKRGRITNGVISFEPEK